MAKKSEAKDVAVQPEAATVALAGPLLNAENIDVFLRELLATNKLLFANLVAFLRDFIQRHGDFAGEVPAPAPGARFDPRQDDGSGRYTLNMQLISTSEMRALLDGTATAVVCEKALEWAKGALFMLWAKGGI